MTPRARVTHKVKCWPEFFQPMLNGLKRFDLRRDDRPEGFQVGDQLLEQEWDPKLVSGYDEAMTAMEALQKGYTGREVLVRVDYIMPAHIVAKLMGKVTQFVIMSVSRVN